MNYNWIIGGFSCNIMMIYMICRICHQFFTLHYKNKTWYFSYHNHKLTVFVVLLHTFIINKALNFNFIFFLLQKNITMEKMVENFTIQLLYFRFILELYFYSLFFLLIVIAFYSSQASSLMECFVMML